MDLTSSKKLCMHECEALKEGPSRVTVLKALELLCFHSCKAFKNIPEEFDGLTWLRKLSMHDCEVLEEFASGVTKLKALELISFHSFKMLKHIPEGLRGLTCLKKRWRTSFRSHNTQSFRRIMFLGVQSIGKHTGRTLWLNMLEENLDARMQSVVRISF